MRIQNKHNGLTIIELTVVILILSILSAIAVGVYTGYLERARYVAARSTIEELELAISRYEVDLGEFPLSGRYKGPLPASGQHFVSPIDGNGNLMLCLMHSTSADANNPSDPRWFGPYIKPQFDDMGDHTGQPIVSSTAVTNVNLLDPWGNPYRYVRSSDYTSAGATEQTSSPFYSTEVYYNPLTYQIFSLGPDGVTEPDSKDFGLGPDDVNNFDQR